MRFEPRRIWWLAPLLALAGLTALYAGAMRTGFLNDDYLFIEEARTRPLVSSLVSPGTLANYYRPLSRQLYFEALTPLAGYQPLAFHLVNFALFLASLALLADLLRAFLPWSGVMAGVLVYALLPFQRVNLTWVSCSQDLMALVFTLAAVALFRRGSRWSAIAFLAALASKESALPLPIVLAAWALKVERRSWHDTVLALRPHLVVLTAWVALALAIRARHAVAAAFLHFDPGHFAAGYVHMVQSVLGLEHPPGLPGALASVGPAPIPLALLGALALWLAHSPGSAASPRVEPRPVRGTVVFGLVWLVAFGAVTGPVASTWSAYYYTLAAVGAALLAGVLMRRIGALGWLVLTAAMLWLHAGSSATRAFAIEDRPWGWTSHLTSFYFDRGAALSDTLRRQLGVVEPSPPPRTRFFFSTLPPWAGFQMGNGALVRDLYRDSTLQSYFYSQFSESTAAYHPLRFLWWDGRAFTLLYGRARDPLFQVGTDLLLLDRPAGASHAFRRALLGGGDPRDNSYWLGFASLWQGRRAEAEEAWSAAGARDDSVTWLAYLGEAKRSLEQHRDTLRARRALLIANLHGIGRPEGHAVLGELLMRDQPKYGMLELKVASMLKPDDWLARRGLFTGLVAARLDEPALRELAVLERIHPQWRSDSILVAARRTLEGRTRSGPIAEL